MTSTFTPNKGLEQPANGSYDNDWDVPVNADWTIVDTALGGTTSISVTSVASGTYPLTLTQYQPPNIEFTGTLSANLVYQLPAGVGGIWTIYNNTSGSFTLAFSVSGGNSYTLPQGQRSMLVSDGSSINTTQTFTAPTSQSIGILIWGQTTQERNAGVTPTYYFFPPGDWLRYGADPTGTNDSTAAINAANSCNGISFDILGGTYLCSAVINLPSNVTMYGTGSATVLKYANGGINQVLMSGASHATLKDLKIQVTGNASAQVAGVYVLNSTYCTVMNVELTGMTAAGITLDCSNYCKITRNWCHDFVSSNNYGDIQIYCQSSSTAGALGNEISFNVCNGTNSEFGIAVWDGYFATSASGFPTYTLVKGNYVGAHTGYGLLCYLPGSETTSPGACNTYNEFVDNTVVNITGTASSNNQSGAGVYVVGQGVGATQVLGNKVYNCCTGTTTAGLAPAGIGINGVPTGIVRPLIANNTINGMSQGDGIAVVSSPGGAVVASNVVNMPSNNNGTGAGGASLVGSGIHIFNSSLVTVGQNDVQSYGTGSALSLYASSGNVNSVNINGGTYLYGGSNGYAFQGAQANGNNITYLSVNGANFTSTSTDAINVSAIIVGSFSGVIGQSSSGRALVLNGCQYTRVGGGGSYTTGGSTAIDTASTCTGTYIDKSVNVYPAAAGSFTNAGSGSNIEWRSTAAPTSGTWQRGDHVQNTSPSSTGTPGWYCTTGGSPGTWTPEASL